MQKPQPKPIREIIENNKVFHKFLILVVISLLLPSLLLVIYSAVRTSTGHSIPTETLRILENSSTEIDVAKARVLLNSSIASEGYSASQQPKGSFWIGIRLPESHSTGVDRVLEFRMLRIEKGDFWAVNNLTDKPVKLWSGNEKGGSAVWIPTMTPAPIEIIGKIKPLGVARPKIFLWESDLFKHSTMLFERSGGALLGSFLILAVFSAIVGLINKDWSFFLFSGWLITTLRVASINDGWDLFWLGISVDEKLLLAILRGSLAAHALLTVALFRSLLQSELSGTVSDKLLKHLSTIVCFLIFFAIFTPHSIFLPALWFISSAGILVIIATLLTIVAKTRSRVSILYSASWGLTFFGILSEVAYASGLIESAIPGLNAQTTSVASALVTAVALAEKLRLERLARLSAQREKFEVLEKFKENYNAMPVGLFSMTRDGDVRLFNPAFATMFGVSAEQQPQPNLNLGALIGDSALGRILDAGNSPGSSELEFKLADPQLGGRWFLARLSPKEETIEGSLQEITLRKEAEAKLRHLVDHDSLTGLLNQHGLEDAMALALSEVARGNPSAVAHVDLDRFKLINELYGHAVGDAMLTEMAQRLSKTVRTRDFVARIGDSFVVVFMDCPDIAAAGLADRLRESVGDQPFHILGKTLGMTVSIGVVAIEQSMKAVDALAAADRACAEAKYRGRNCVVQFNERDGMLKRHLEELKVVADLRHRIPTDRYFLEFQPIVSLRAAGNYLSYEVLIRMRDEEGGVLAPGRFIGAAERNGLMSQIDRWVLANTLSWIDEHPEHRNRLTFATLNLSGASLNDARFVEDAFAMIAEHPHAVRKVCFEITESVALHDVNSTQRFVERVRAFGSQVALDDFGAGYTSFNYLKEIPANYIKIDGSFVKDINLNPANYAITRTIVDLTHELGMQSIAEWAETSDTVASLLELGVDYAQGFGLARPMPKELVTGAISCGALLRDPTLVAMLSSPQSIPGLTAKTKRSG